MSDSDRLTADEGEARKLANALRSVAMAEIDRRGLILRPARLPAHLLRPQHRQRMRAALEVLLGANRARLFRLADMTTVVLWRGEAQAQVSQALDGLRLAIADLPSALTETAGLVTLVELPRDTEIVLRVIEESIGGVRPPRGVALRGGGTPLDVGALATLEQALAQADVAHLARRKLVCQARQGEPMRLAWEKRYISVAELSATLVPEHSPQADPWLFRRLTRTLDRRMLTLLSHPEELRLAGPFSLNLNVASILSPQFTRFDTGLPASLRGEVVLDLLPADIMADLTMFQQARNSARDRGYRLLLRGVTSDLMAVLPIDMLGLDLLQLRWSADLARLAESAVAGIADRVVLGGADHQDAIDWGMSRGIGLFQGAQAQPAPAVTRVPLPGWRRHTALS